MDKLKMHTPDLAEENFRKLAELFPNAVTETITGYDDHGKAIVERAIDADVLRQEISASVVEGAQERYQFTWPDKKKSVVLANQPIAKTLRLVREKSVGRDGTPGSIDTENIYIEGDNLDVLKILQEPYLGKIKMIYIDPPYNTGKDFVYGDDYSIEKDEYLENSGQFDEEGNKLFQNTESNGRFHTDWLNMIFPRLRLSKDLLRDDGAIFISVDDNELKNMLKLCDEIFGRINFAACIPWQSRLSVQNDTDLSINHEYIIVYAKKRRLENRRLKETNANKWFIKDSFVFRPLPLDKSKFDNPDNDPRGLWKADPFDAPGVRPNLTYVIKNPITGEEYLPPTGRHWRIALSKFKDAMDDGRIVFGKNGTGRPQMKSFYEEKKDYGSIDNSWFSGEIIGTTTAGTKELQALFGTAPFDTPKPTTLIQKLMNIGFVEKDDIVLDFFSGSATTAHAVLKQNSEDNGVRKYILVQVNERCNGMEKGNQRFETICDIGEERIRRAGKKIQEEFNFSKHNLDIGFRVFKVDTTNMEDIYYKSADYRQEQLELFADNIKKDRTPEDLLIQVMLDLGILLSSKIEETVIASKRVFSVADGYLIACFADNVTEEVVKAIAQKHPYFAVFRDSGMASDSVMTNFEQIFETYSPRTQRKVL